MDFGLPRSLTGDQFLYRAAEAKSILSIPEDADIYKYASRIALAELVQIVFFIALTVIYSLAFSGYLSPNIVGIITFSLLPIEAISSFNTFVHYKTTARYLLTTAAILTLASCAGFALFGIVSDSVITLSAGGVALHVFRNIADRRDIGRAKQNKEYRRIIEQNPVAIN